MKKKSLVQEYFQERIGISFTYIYECLGLKPVGRKPEVIVALELTSTNDDKDPLCVREDVFLGRSLLFIGEHRKGPALHCVSVSFVVCGEEL